MPKITSMNETAQFRVTVSKRILESFQGAMKKADAVGLKVDIQPDVEALLRKLTKIINDAVSESSKPSNQDAGL